MTKNIYILSGLGADERVFQRLDFSHYHANYIQWILPTKNESIENYASRLLPQIKNEKPILIGLSFGGIMAIEIAKLIETEKVILISSAKTRMEIPFCYRIAGSLELHKLLPTGILRNSNFITNWLFGTTSTSDKVLLKQILLDTDVQFMKWAIDKIVHFTNQTTLLNLVHIHGSSDKILPFRNVKCNHTIKNGGHFMILNKASEINEILKIEIG